MKGKLYIFGIGGTGARVIKSLVMLSATGVNVGADAIVPIIVDPDFANADVTRTIDQIKVYTSIRNKLTFNDGTKNNFFKTNFENVVNDYRLTIKDTKNKKFKDFIEYGTMSKANQALASMLFSESNLDADMEVGFKGNPNIGSVVLNQFTDSQDFVDFAAAFKPGDRIFIISSIFGGTGASGFPLLLKTLRSLDASFANSDAIRHAPIGAISVLPYFAVKPNEESLINSSTFIGKTKAALQYYEKNVSGNKSSVNALYYIGDERSKQYENEEGGETQRNDAHIVELAAALSIVDFTYISDEDTILHCIEDNNDKVYAQSPDFREFGLENDVQEVIFGNLTQDTRELICAPMTQFVLFSKFITKHLSESKSLPWAKENGFDTTFFKSTFSNNVKKFIDKYICWLMEMSRNDRSFKPFELSVSDSNIFSIVDGIEPGSIRTLWGFNKSGYNLFDAALNEKHSSLKNNYTSEQKFIELFFIVTGLLVDKKYRF